MADKLQSVYDALKTDGQFQQARSFQDFKNKMAYQGYRSQIYKNLKDAGANVGTFSHFTSSLGYQSGSPKTKQTSQKQSKLMQAAQQVGQGFQPSGETSAFVQSLYEQDNAEQESANNPLARPIDYTSKDAVKGIVDRTSQRNNARQQATSKAVVDDVRKKASQQYQPIVSTGTPADYSVVKNQGQLLDEMQNSASEFVKNNLTADINNAIAGEFNAGHKRGMDAIANTPPAATVGNPTNNIFAGIRDAQAYNREIDPDKLLANLSQKFGDNVKNLMSDPSRKQQILEQANRLGVTPEAYIQNAVAPKIQEQLQQQFDKNETLRHMPRGDAEYVIGGLMDSVYGSLLNAAITTKSQRQYQQKALQEYKPSRAAELGRSVVTLTGDAPIMGGIGKGVGAGMKAALGNTAAKAANMSTLGRLAYLSGTGAVSGAANFSAYEGLGGMIQYASTSDDTSVGQFASNILKAGGERAAHGAVSGAALGTIGGVLGSFGTNLGIKAADRTLGKKILHGSEKLGYEGLKVVGEGIGFATGDVINDVIINHPEGVTITDTLQDAADEFRKKLPESIATAAVFKATNHGTLTKAIMSPKDFAKSIVMSAEGQTSQFKFTPEEKQQLFNTGLGEEMGVKDGNILSWARKAKNRQKYDDPYLNEDTAMIRTYYDRIMADPNIAWKTKAKFTALVGGAMPTSAPIHSYSTFSLENSGDKNVGYVNYVNSYAKDGTLIERQRYNTAEERDAIKYRLESEAEQKSFQNTLGFSLITDMADSRMKETFLRQAGWKEDEPADSPTNKKLLEDLENGDSELSKQYKDFCWKNGSVSRLASEVMNKYNVTPEEFWNAADKDPMKRTDNEQRMIIEYKNAVHASLEKAGEPYPELAAEDGKELVREAALGTDAPNNKMVISELDKLTQAEKALEEAAAGNDLLREGMEAMRKQGLSPLDMYQEFLNPESPFAGMNKEQLAPLAEYINQSARVQGMMQGTQQKIEENVNAFVSEWAYKGTLDGQRVEDGSQVIFVKDELGNTLILGRGDVAFDENGRPKEGIGDMVMCYEPATNEMKPVSVKDITFAGSELSEEYANSRKQVLQAKNEEAYVAAAQAQAETSSNNAAAPEGSSTPKAEKKDGQKSKSQGNYRDRLEAAGVVGKSESPVGMIEFNPANGNATSLSNSLAMMIEKRVERTLDNPDSTIQDLHDAIVFTLADGNGRVSASTSVLTDVYNAFNAMKEGKLSKTDVLDYVKELMYTKDKLTSGAQESTPIQTDPTPIGTSAFGNVYDAFRGKVKEAFDFLLKHKSGDLQGVFSRNDVGDIDLIWGDRSKNQGLDHIIDKHIEQHNDFASVEEAAKVIEDVITNGTINEKKSRWDKVVLEKDGYMVVIRKNVRNENGDIVVSNKNWIVTAFDNNHQAEYKKRTPSDVTRATPNTVDGGRAVTPDGSPFAAKVQQNPETPVNNSEKLKLSDGRDVPLDEKGEPDFMKMEAKDGAEVYQTLFPDTYEAEIDNAVKSAEKALRDANKMKPKGKGIMERAKEQQNIKETVALAEQQLEKAKAIKRSLTEQKIASTIESQKPTAEPSKEISDEVRDKFQNAPKVKGTEGSITLPDGTEIDGTYYLVSSESLTPSHDANNGYKANEGLPTNPDGSTLNDRDYEHDKSYRQDTDKAARSYDGRALNDVPIISDEGFVYSGNGRTMAGQKAAVEGTDGKYIDNLKKNAGRFGLTREQIENSGIEHPRVVFVPKERLPYDTATMRKFNKEDKKSESNVAEAVANSKTLTSTDVGSIIAAIEGSGKDGAVGTIESFFNSPKAISGLVKTLQEKGILGSNEVAKYMDGDLLSAQGKEYVKNLLLGSMFKEETIRMMGIESTLKNKAISAIRTIMENQKLGDYSLRDEIDQAIKLLYEAKTKGDKVDTLLRTIDAFNGNAADRYPSISQMMAIALEGKVGDFRDLLDSYNRNAAQHNTNEGTLFGDKPTKEEFINEFLNFKNWKDYGTRHSEEKADAHVGGIQGNEPQAPGANGERPTTETKQGVEPLKTNNDGRQEETANGNNDDQSEDNGIGVDRIRTREVSPLADEGNLQMLGEEMASLRSEHLSDSERNRRRAASERLVEKAKESGDYISEKETRKLGERNPNHTGESVIYIDKENGKVYKVKDPYAKSAMKSGVQPEDAPFEHYVHNILFPDTRYTLEAISDVNGEVRLVLSQNYIKSAGRATKEQIEEALAKLGLVKEDGYSYGNEYVSVTDVEGDNVLVGADGKVYFIDPIIRFKKPLSEILGKMQIGKRRKSLFYIAMSDWVKTPVEREREKKEADAEAERQKLAEIESKFQEEKQKFKGKEKYNDYAQVLSSSKTIREAVDKLHKKAEACRKEAEDWRSRQYKTNNTVIDSYNIYGEEKTTTISAANERRRQSAIRNAENAAKEYDEMADTLLSRCGLPKDYFAEKPRNLSDPIASIKTNAEQFKTEKQSSAKWYGNPEEMPGYEKMMRSQKSALLKDAATAYQKAFDEVSKDNDFFGGHQDEVTYEDFAKAYREVTDDYSFKHDEPFLPALFEHLSKKLDAAVEARRAERKGAAEQTETVEKETEEAAIDRIYEKANKLVQDWEDRILDYIAEHYPTQANVSAKSSSPQGLKEREAMRSDETLKKMREQYKSESDTAIKEADAEYDKWLEENGKDKLPSYEEKPYDRVAADKKLDELSKKADSLIESLELVDKAHGYINEYREHVKNGDKEKAESVLKDLRTSLDAIIRGSGKNLSDTERRKIVDERIAKIDTELNSNLRQQKADTPSEISEREAALRDAVISKIKQSGIEVVTDVEEGQRMLDLVNDVFLSKRNGKKKGTETALPSDKSPFKGTVVSSSDGAKVLKKVDTLVNDLEKTLPALDKNFIGYVAKAFGMERPATSSSQYATFETVNGDVVTFRLSDHNARQSGFDGAGRDNGISIVISRKSNNGITEDGDAHIVEFYYSDKALRQAQGHPLAEIVKSMKQALYSGEYNDTTGLAERGEVPSGVIREMKAYHGSGADFDHFDHSHMGEGEGAQSFGWGTYVTDVEEVGRYYAEGNTQDYNNPIIRAYFKVVRNEVENGVPFEEAKQKTLTILDKLRKGIEGKEDAYASFIAAHERFKGLKEEDLFNRHLYTVEIPDDNGKNYLEWDKEYNENEVYEIVERMLDKAVEYEKRGDWDNGEKFRDVANALAERIDKEVSDKDGKGTLSGELLYYNVSTDAKTASELLNEAGFVGIKYPAGYFSGGNPEGNKNYVIFNEADAKITDHIRYFKTKSGHAYGYTDGKKIYIDPRIATSETPIHEYTHLWATALKNTNQKGWADVVRLMKGTDVWNKVTEKYPELKTDDEIADEVLAQFSGKRGAERLRQMAEGINPGDVMKKTEVLSTVGKIKQALEKFWNYVKEDILGIQRRFKSAEEIADSVMKDLMDGVNPTKKATEDGERYQFVGERGAAAADHAEEVTTRMDNLSVARQMKETAKDAKAIKMATGWELGADDKWRYEIPDAKFDLYRFADLVVTGGNISLDKLLSGAQELLSAYPELKNIYVFADRPEFMDGATGYYNNTLKQIRIAQPRVSKQLEKLWERLSSLKDNRYYLEHYAKSDGMSESERKRKLAANEKMLERAEGSLRKLVSPIESKILSTIHHEVQHAIQYIEGFANGGNPDMFTNTTENVMVDINEAVGGHLFDNGSVENNTDGLYKALRQKVYGRSLLMSYEDALNEVAEKYGYEDIYDLADNIENIKSSMQKYRALAGEVESRNVQSRMNMTAEERRASLASETEDVSREDQLFLFGDGGRTMLSGDKIRIGETFSKDKESFDKVRERAIREKGIVTPNLKEKDVNVVDVPMHDFTSEDKKEEASNWAFSHLQTKDKNNLPTLSDGTPYTIGRKAILKFVDESSFKGDTYDEDAHFSILKVLPQIVHESIETEIHPDYIKGADGQRSTDGEIGKGALIHRFFGAARIDDKIYRIKTTIKELRGNNTSAAHSYEVTKIELVDNHSQATEADRGHLGESNNSISAAKLLKGVEKSHDAGKKLLDESQTLTIGSTHFRESTAPQQSQTQEVVSNHIDQVVKKVGGKVKKVNTIEEVTNTNARKAIEEGRKITGWYEEATGEVHLYMPNIHDRYTAEKTVWHELVGHQGLRGLFGDKFNTFMRSLWYDLDNPVNKELREYVNANLARNKFDVYDTIEEFCAEQAEKGRGEAGFWNNIRNKFTDVLHETGYRIAPNTKDVKYLLWLGKNLQKHPNDPVWKMRQESVLHKLENERVPSVIEQHGVIMENNGKHTSLDDLPRHEYNEATDGKVHFMTSPNKSFEIEQYNNALSSKAYAFKESTVDAMQSLQEAMLAISPKYKKVEDIPAYMNPYLAQNRAQSMEQQKGEAFERSLAKPLTKIFSKVVDSFTGKDLTERSRNAQLYMIAKSGLERNRVFYVRDAVRKLMDDDTTKQQGEQLQQDWETLKRAAGQALESGKIDLTEYYEHLDDFIRTNIDDKYNAGEHDYAGFHGMYDLAEGEAYNDAEVIEKVKDAEACMGDAATKELWRRINDVTSYSLTEDYNNGFIDKPTHDHVQGMMDWYVPMRKFDEVTAEDVYGYITEKGDPRNNLGSTLMNAKGRTSLADTNVLAQMMAMASGSIHRGVQNGIKQHLLRFINSEEKDKAVSDRLFVETKAWMEKHTVAGKDEWVEVYPQINGTTPKDISASIAAFESRMQSLKAQGLAKEVTGRGDVGYKFVRAKDKSEHLVEVMVGGKKKVFVCQGNPRVAQAVNGMLKNSGAKFKRISNFTRIAAQLSTSWNPDFVLSNMRRDFHFASASIYSKEGAKFALQFEKQYHSNLASFMQKNDNDYYGYFSKFRNGTLGNSKKEQMFREFMENGGETGFTQLHTMEQWTKDINDAVNLDKSKSAKLSKAFKSKTVDVIEAANEIVENIARFSAYCTSREAGRSVGRSIYDAKEVSTNFNRSGSGDAIKTLKTENDTASDATFRSSLGAFNSYMRNYTMFYNAGIQGAALFTKNLKQNTIRAAVSMTAIPFTLGAGAMPIINAALIAMEDEKDRDGMKDPYAELPDYQRRNNICIYIGNGRFYDIPLPIEMRAFYGIGDLAAGYLFNERLRSDGNLTSDIIGQLAQIVPATDFLGHHAPGDTPQQVLTDVAGTFVPQALKPLYEVGMNRNWTGRPIYKDSDYLNDAPSWKKSYASTNEWLMNFNKFLNKQTNGIDNTNEDLKGNATLDWLSHPGGIQALYEGYLGGLGTSGRRLGETMQKVGGIAKGAVTGDGSLNELKNLDFNQVPIVRTFLYTPREGSDMQRTKTKWYNYKEELSTASYNLQQLNHKTSDPLKALRNAAAKHRFAKSVEGIAINKMKGYEKSMKRWKKVESLSSDPDAVKNAQLQQNLIMQEAVDELDRLYDVGMKQKQ